MLTTATAVLALAKGQKQWNVAAPGWQKALTSATISRQKGAGRGHASPGAGAAFCRQWWEQKAA